jgi:hypothetical protein
MAQARKGGDERATRRDGPGGAGAGAVVPRQAGHEMLRPPND